MWINLFQINSFIIPLVEHKVTICYQIPYRPGQRSRLPFDRTSSWIFSIICIGITLVSQTWLYRKQTIELSWYSETPTDIRSDSKRWTVTANQPTLPARASSTWSIFVHVIQAISKHVVICFNCFARLWYVWSHKGNQSHTTNDCHISCLLTWDWVKFWCKSAIRLATFHQNCLLHAARYSKKWW